ncbi:hypothetical protein E2C01_074296 [Portunus trituberculatus]|uniref:Uncharacterized protein n=1 Tax=Portunus trituberculatus TaxID=210409 RepID=A0A5B7I7P6_PORTR|nr:hypothetical protein [Portunus trituberculatus]
MNMETCHGTEGVNKDSSRFSSRSDNHAFPGTPFRLKAGSHFRVDTLQQFSSVVTKNRKQDKNKTKTNQNKIHVPSTSPHPTQTQTTTYTTHPSSWHPHTTFPTPTARSLPQGGSMINSQAC